MRVIPYSHTRLLAHRRDAVSNHFISCEDDPWVQASEPTAVAACMDAGGIIFFSYNTAHSTGDNLSAFERAVCSALAPARYPQVTNRGTNRTGHGT
eukprot:SAG31_NODE_1447_length_8308_cov_58.914881_7_plen_96_part_00